MCDSVVRSRHGVKFRQRYWTREKRINRSIAQCASVCRSAAESIRAANSTTDDTTSTTTATAVSATSAADGRSGTDRAASVTHYSDTLIHADPLRANM